MSKRRFADRAAADLAWQPPSDAAPTDLTRLAIDACLEGPLADREWSLLDAQGLIADIKQRRRTPGQAATLVEQWRDAVAGPNPRIRSGSVSTSLRADAVAHLVAVEAAKDGSVIEFRDRVLRGKLLVADQVDRWLTLLARRQDVKAWVKVYASPEEIEMGVVPMGQSNTVAHGYDTLECVVPGCDQVRRILVSSKGILGWLRWLSIWLSARFLWEKSRAATFVLTGATPPIKESEYNVDGSRAVPALTRVVMTIDPTMSPREVANLYREIRFRHFGRRHRSMTAKHVELAKFWSMEGEDEAWKDLKDKWNKLHPKWAYRREQNLARDCAQARRRLLGEGIAKAVARPE
jgi:hypothetical protein